MRRRVSSELPSGALLLALLVRCAASCSAGASGVSDDAGATETGAGFDASAADRSSVEASARDGGGGVDATTGADGSAQDASSDGDGAMAHEAGPNEGGERRDGSTGGDGGVCATPGFPGPPWPTTDPLPQVFTVATADFNGDGIVDLLGAGFGAEYCGSADVGAVILLGHGDGSFAAPSPSAPPPNCYWTDAVALDVDGDGKPDALALNHFDTSPTSVVFARGLGDGTLAAPLASATGPNRTTFAVGDFDSDGRVDAVVAGSTACESVLGFMKGNGDGTFQVPVDIDPSEMCLDGGAAEIAPRAIKVGDFDADGNLDFVASGDGLVAFLGNGDGTFRLQPPLATASGFSYAAAVGDLNGDGKADLALGPRNFDTFGQVQVRLSRGDGTFDAPHLVDAYSPYYIDLADVDGDGLLDLLTAGTQAWFGRGDGTFGDPVTVGPPQRIHLFSNLSYPNATVTDLNGDGVPDLALATSRDYVDVVLGMGGRAFALAPEFPTNAYASNAAVTGDFNGDGKADLLVAGASISALMGDGKGGFGAPLTTTLRSPALSVAVGDLDGDGIDDLLLGGAESTLVYLGAGDGTFTLGTRLDAQGHSVALGDVNGDGKPDAVMIERNTYPHATGFARVALGHGNGTFEAPASFVLPNRFQGTVALADFTGDGKPDIAVALDSGIELLPGRGDGMFGDAVNTTLQDLGFVAGLAVGDFNGDGRPELAVAIWRDVDADELAPRPGVTLLSGDGDGHFAVGPMVSGAGGSQSIAVGDFDEDGTLDVAVTTLEGTLGLFAGDGHGDLRFLGPFPSTTSVVQWVASADFDRDGRGDLAAVSPTEATLLRYQCR